MLMMEWKRYIGLAVLGAAATVVAGCGPSADLPGDPQTRTTERALDGKPDGKPDSDAREASASFPRPGLGSRRLGRDAEPVRRDHPGPDSRTRSYSPKALADRVHVIAPWTRVLSDGLAEQAAVSKKRVSFPAESAELLSDLQRFDIIISGSKHQPFLRRVLRVDSDEQTGRLVVHTGRATLAEAILKGSIQTGQHRRGGGDRPDGSGQPDSQPAGQPADQPTDQPDSVFRRRHQALRNGGVDYESLGRFGGELGEGGIPELIPPVGVYKNIGGAFDVSISGRPTFSIEPRYWFSLDIDFDAGDKSPAGFQFYSTRTCDSDTDCFDGGLSGGEECQPYFPSIHDVRPEVAQHLTPYDRENRVQYCVYRPGVEGTEVRVREEDGDVDEKDEYRTCERILETLEWVKEDGDGHECGRDWQTWYDSKGHRGARNPDSCHGWFWDAFAPYPAQLEWAKLVCHGSVKHLEMDFQTDLKAGVEDFQMSALGSGFKAWTPIDMDTKNLANPMFWVGWVPVVLTFNFDFSMPVVLSVTGDVSLNKGEPKFVGVEHVSIPGGGLHMYTSEEAYEEGHFGPPSHRRPRGYLNDLHVNDVPQQTARIHTPEVDGNLQGSLYMSLNPELNLLLYDMVGPYLRPFEPYVEFIGAVGTEKSCNLGLKVGAKGELGLKAQLPFGLGATQKKAPSAGTSSRKSTLRKALELNPFASWSLYNTCSADQTLLEKTLFGEGESSGEASVDEPADIMCREGLEELCWRECLAGSCPPEDDGEEKADSLADQNQPVAEAGPKNAAGSGGCSTSPTQAPLSAPTWALLVVLAGWVRRTRT